MSSYIPNLSPDSGRTLIATGYVKAPGSIDLSGLWFSPAFNDDDEDDDNTRERRRQLHQGPEIFLVDIVVTRLPNACVLKFPQQNHDFGLCTEAGCDWIDCTAAGWAELGVGVIMDNSDGSTSGIPTWCCSQEAQQQGLCQSNSGQDIDGVDHDHFSKSLIVTKSVFTGEQRQVQIPSTGYFRHLIRYGKIEESDSGQYIVMMANCKDDHHGREVSVTGTIVWNDVTRTDVATYSNITQQAVVDNHDNHETANVINPQERSNWGLSLLVLVACGVALFGSLWWNHKHQTATDQNGKYKPVSNLELTSQ